MRSKEANVIRNLHGKDKSSTEKLQQAVIELFEAEGYKHLTGDHIHKEMADLALQHLCKDATPWRL